MNQLITYLNNLWTKTIAPSWKRLSEASTDRIVKAIQSKENPTHITVTNPTDIKPIVEAQNATTEAVRAIPRVEIPETDFSSLEAKLDALKTAFEKKKMDVKVGKTKVDVDTKSVVKAIEKLEKSMPKMEKQEIADYTLMLDEMMKIMEKPHYAVDIIRIQDSLNRLATTEDMVALSAYLQTLIDKPYPEMPELPMSKGRIKVEVDKVGGGGGGGLTKIETDALTGINDKVATEAKQDDIIAGQYPTGTGSNGTVTFTNANTAYAIPGGTAPTGSYVLAVYNGSDTDMYWGYATLTSGGILLPAGGTLTLNLGANDTIFAYCGSAGKVVNYSLKLTT